MQAVVSVVFVAILLVGCASEGVSRPNASASTSSIAKPTTSTAPPIRNAEGEITGDPFAQCEITQSTAQPEPPDCVGNPRFEWERAPTVEPREGGGWLTEGILLSDPNQPWVTVGFRLSEVCIVDQIVVEETDDSVSVGLHYWTFDAGEADACVDSDKKWALQRFLDQPLNDRVFVFQDGATYDWGRDG